MTISNQLKSRQINNNKNKNTNEQRGIFQLIKQPVTYLVANSNNDTNIVSSINNWPQMQTPSIKTNQLKQNEEFNQRKLRVSTHYLSAYSSSSSSSKYEPLLNKQQQEQEHVYDEINYDLEFLKKDDTSITRTKSIDPLVKQKPPLNLRNSRPLVKQNLVLSKSVPNVNCLNNEKKARFWLDSSPSLPQQHPPPPPYNFVDHKHQANLPMLNRPHSQTTSMGNINLLHQNSLKSSIIQKKSFLGQNYDDMDEQFKFFEESYRKKLTEKSCLLANEKEDEKVEKYFLQNS